VVSIKSQTDCFNPDYIRQILEFLGHLRAGGVTEVRILPKDRYIIIGKRRVYVGNIISGYYSDYDKLASDVEAFDGKANIYITLSFGAIFIESRATRD